MREALWCLGTLQGGSELMGRSTEVPGGFRSGEKVLSGRAEGRSSARYNTLPQSLLTAPPPNHKNTCLFFSLLTALYTITTLESGGYEMEFPSRDFLTELQGLLRRVYPSSRWQVYSSRAVTKLYYDTGEAGTHDPSPVVRLHPRPLTCDAGGSGLGI